MKFHTVDTQGKFWTERVADKDTTHHRSVIDEGRMIYSHSDSKLYFGAQNDWKIVMGKYDFMTAETRLLFGYFPLPDGWNINTTKNDMTVMMVLDNRVGQIDGSWTISGIESSGVHDHGGAVGTPDASIAIGKSDIRTPQAASQTHTHTIFADGQHIHGFNINWRPSYVKFVEAKFD